MKTPSVIPLIIDGQDIVAPDGERQSELANKSHDGGTTFYQGATKALALQVAESSAKAYRLWSKTTPIERRRLLLNLAEVCKRLLHRLSCPQLTRNKQILRKRSEEIKQVCCDEINCGPLWADINTADSIGLIEEYASLTTSVATGSIPFVQSGYGLVMKEPLGVVLGIAPWNAPVILGLRAVVAPIAAGNVAILKARPVSPPFRCPILCCCKNDTDWIIAK